MNEEDTRLVNDLKKVIDMLETDTYQGVLWYSNSVDDMGFGKAVKGDMYDRIRVLDLMFASIYSEPNEKSKIWGMQEVYKRFKYYFGKLEDVTNKKSGIA